MKLKDCLFILFSLMALVIVWDTSVGGIFVSTGEGIKAGTNTMINGIQNRRTIPRK